MIVSPARSSERVAVAVLVDAGRALCEDGRIRAYYDGCGDRRVYAPWSLTERLVQAGRGCHLAWGDEPIRWRPRASGRPLEQGDAVVLRFDLPEHPPTLLAGLAAWRDWLLGAGARPGWSFGGSSLNLLRSTLKRPLLTAHGELPPARWTLGGRQQSWFEPGRVSAGAVHVDLPAAYPRVLGGLRYGGVWRRLGRPSWQRLETLAGFERPLLVRGEARLNNARLEFGPLPRRPQRRPVGSLADLLTPTVYPLHGRLRGMWTYEEVANLVQAGGSFRCKDAYMHNAPQRDAYPFRAWLEECERGRLLENRLGAFLAKSTAAALWGQFIVDDRKRLRQVWYEGGVRRELMHPARKGRGSSGWDVGELVCGRVRARLWELMQQAGRKSLICVHTDGGWVESGKPPTALPADWRVKDRAVELELVDQARLRWRPAGRPERWRYTFAGAPAADAPALFEALFARFAGVDAGAGKRGR